MKPGKWRLSTIYANVYKLIQEFYFFFIFSFHGETQDYV